MAEEELHRQHETLQARDKVVLKMTRDGAAEENLTQDSTERISQRPEDAVFQREEEPLFRKRHLHPTSLRSSSITARQRRWLHRIFCPTASGIFIWCCCRTKRCDARTTENTGRTGT